MTAPSAVFARTVTDALECRQRTLVAHRILRGAVGKTSAELDGQVNPYPHLVDWTDDHRLLTQLPTHWWTPATARLVTNAAESFPLTRQMHSPATAKSFSVFSEPCLFADFEGERMPLSALAWSMVNRISTGRVDLAIRAFFDNGVACVPVWWSSIENPLDISDQTFPNMADEAKSFLRWILAGSAFLEQKVLRTTNSIAERHARKRAQQSELVDTSVQAVYLREVEYSPGERPATNAAADVDWQYRWWVKGHWRNQWFASKEEHFPLWIQPHVKGPDDRPFKQALEQVYAVTR